ncbi:MAG: hypothetical protein ABL986_22660 [Vicinamibacterales bacterium]
MSAAIYHIPIQVSDSLEVIETVSRASSVRTAFVDALYSSRSMLRPLRQAQTKLLTELGPDNGVAYTRALRGFHALTAAVLFLLFTAVVRPRTWNDLAPLAFALTVLTGLHTSAGMFREAYPVNHFLLISIYCVATFALARSRGGLASDVVAVVCFALAAHTLESGLVILPLAVAGYLAGLRGISVRGLSAMVTVTAGYFLLRIGYLDMVGTEIGERPTGYWLWSLDSSSVQAIFGTHTYLLAGYTVVSSVVTVLLSQPVNGTWTVIRAALDGRLVAADIIPVVSSLLTTGLIAWHVFSRDAHGHRRTRDPLLLAGVTVLVGTAAISYAYAKSEIMSAAGVFYALLVCDSARSLTNRRGLPALAIAVVVIASSLWTLRAMGLMYQLERSAFAARNEWAHDERYELGTHTSTPLESSLKREALQRTRTNPLLLTPALGTLWGEP